MASRTEYEMLFKLNAQLNNSFNSSFKSGQNSVSAMQKEIETLNKTQSDISAYQKQQSAISATKQRLDVLQEQYDNIQKEMSETGEFSSKLANQLLTKQQQIDKANVSIDAQTQKLGQMGAALNEAGVNTNNLTQESARLAEKIENVKDEQEAAAAESSNFGSAASAAFLQVGQALAAAGIVAALKEIAEWFGSCLDAAVEFESVMAGVKRTVGGTDETLAILADEFKEMSVVMPITTSELGKIAETAGQLGVAQDVVSEFTEVMAMLATTTDLTADNAATMLAQFANITGTSDYQRLGSAVAELGDATATTASKVVDMSQGMAAAATIAGFSETDILATAAAVGSLGIEAQAGSTSMSTLIQTLYKAVETGNDSLEDFAAVANMTAEEFSTAWGESAVSAMDAFIQGLNDTERNGRSAVVILDELGITNVRQTKAILGLASAGDLLSGTINQANEAWAENTALQAKADIMYNTTQSKLVMMQNAYSNLKISIGELFTPALQKLYEIATKVLTGITKFVEEHPAAVKALTAFVAIIGAVTAALAAYKVVALLAAKASALFTAAIPGLGPIMAVATGIASVVSAIVLFTDSTNESIPSVKELTAAAREMSDAMDAAAETFDSTYTSTLATVNMAETYIEMLEDLEAAGIETEEQAAQYHSTLSLLCQVVPELSEYIDLETDTIEGGTAALRANTAAWAENAKQQAFQEYMTELYSKQAEVVIEMATNKIKLSEAEQKLVAQNRIYNDALARMEGLMQKATDAAAEQYEATGELYDVYSFLESEYWEINDALSEMVDEIEIAEKTVESYTSAIETDNEKVAEAEETIRLATAAYEELSSTVEEGSYNAEVAIANVTGEIKALVEAYDSAYDAALKSVEGQYKIWDSAAENVKISATSIISGIESQIEYWQKYNANLDFLSGKSKEIEGLSDVLISFADGSAESVSAVAGLAGATDAELEKMVADWLELRKEQDLVAGSLAELETDFEETMDSLQSKLETTVENMDMYNETVEIGKNIMLGLVNGATSMESETITTFSGMAQKILTAFDTTLDINSPSREMDWRAEMTWAGYIDRTKSMMPELQTVMSDAANVGLDAVASEQVQMVALAPQFFEALNAMHSNDGISADIGSVGGLQPVSISIDINIEGDADADTVSRLEQTADDFADRVREVLEEIKNDDDRGSYL